MSDFPSPLKSAVGGGVRTVMSEWFNPAGLAAGTATSLVPAAVPSVIQRFMLPLLSAPWNAALPLPNTVISEGFNPTRIGTCNHQLTRSRCRPVTHPKICVTASVLASEQHSAAENRETWVHGAKQPPENA